MTTLQLLATRLSLWMQQPQMMLRVLLALVSLLALVLGAGAGTQWE